MFPNTKPISSTFTSRSHSPKVFTINSETKQRLDKSTHNSSNPNKECCGCGGSKCLEKTEIKEEEEERKRRVLKAGLERLAHLSQKRRLANAKNELDEKLEIEIENDLDYIVEIRSSESDYDQEVADNLPTKLEARLQW